MTDIDPYPVPEKVTVIVRDTTHAGMVSVGDIHNDRKIHRIADGRVWVTFFDEADKKIAAYHHPDMIQVDREIETEESRIARGRAQYNNSIVRTIDHKIQAEEECRAKVGTSPYDLRSFSWVNDVANYMMTNAEKLWWAMVADEAMQERSEDHVAALARVADKAAVEIIRNSQRSSRSTHVLSNYADDIYLEAAANLVGSAEYRLRPLVAVDSQLR